MGKLTLILGGARSGKSSSYAEERAKDAGGDSVLYVATSETKDEEMEQRVEKHRCRAAICLGDDRGLSKRRASPSSGKKRDESHFAGLHDLPGRQSFDGCRCAGR